MMLHVVSHDVNLSGGKALRVDEGDVEGFLCWGHAPTIRAQGGHVPEQFSQAQYLCDFELYDDGVLVLHKERAFSTRGACQAWFRFVAWCLSHLPPKEFAPCHQNAWVLT